MQLALDLRSDIKSILILGAGPIVIGQACEFDYSGAQACSLASENHQISNGISPLVKFGNSKHFFTQRTVHI